MSQMGLQTGDLEIDLQGEISVKLAKCLFQILT